MSSNSNAPAASITGVIPAPLLDANLQLLRQGTALLERIDDATYQRPVAAAFSASLGGHFRHVIEHYTGLLRSLETGDLDYERRERDLRIEAERAHAIAVLQQLHTDLARAGAEGDRALTFRLENAGPGDAAPSTPSTFCRELEYLLSHTVHHYALIAVMARLQGVEPSADFGMAPSTLRFREAQAAAAQACAH